MEVSRQAHTHALAKAASRPRGYKTRVDWLVHTCVGANTGKQTVLYLGSSRMLARETANFVLDICLPLTKIRSLKKKLKVYMCIKVLM